MGNQPLRETQTSRSSPTGSSQGVTANSRPVNTGSSRP